MNSQCPVSFATSFLPRLIVERMCVLLGEMDSGIVCLFFTSSQKTSHLDWSSLLESLSSLLHAKLNCIIESEHKRVHDRVVPSSTVLVFHGSPELSSLPRVFLRPANDPPRHKTLKKKHRNTEYIRERSQPAISHAQGIIRPASKPLRKSSSSRENLGQGEASKQKSGTSRALSLLAS